MADFLAVAVADRRVGIQATRLSGRRSRPRPQHRPRVRRIHSENPVSGVAWSSPAPPPRRCIYSQSRRVLVGKPQVFMTKRISSDIASHITAKLAESCSHGCTRSIAGILVNGLLLRLEGSGACSDPSGRRPIRAVRRADQLEVAGHHHDRVAAGCDGGTAGSVSDSHAD